MKQIKFRAWNSKTQEMTSDFKSEDYSINTFFNNFPFPVMQFTGLKDKNGKEIFEGDLYHTVHSTKTYTIFSKYGAFCGGLSLESCVPLAWMICEEENEIIPDDEIFSLIEVIGNIYETPITS